MLTAPLTSLGAFAVGACVGSFLNVVIWRVPRGQSLVVPGSRCPECGAAIAWHDNIPLLSFFALRRRCRNCRARVSGRYLAIEALAAVAATAAVVRFGLTGRAVAIFAMTGFLLALSAIDLELWILPTGITRIGIAAGLLCAFAIGQPTPRVALVGAVVGWASLTSVGWLASTLLRREALGAGDPALLALIGSFLGWPALLAVVGLASIQGVLVGAVLLALKGRAHPGTAPTHEDGWTPPATAVPFGPYLSLGAVEYVFFDLGRYDPLSALANALG